MLPIISTSSALVTSKASSKTKAIGAVSAQSEALSGEWQQARQGRGNERTSKTIEGELYKDMAAVGDYLSAAGEENAVPLGQIVSVYA